VKLSGLFPRPDPTRPGVIGTARVGRHPDAVLHRARAGDIAVLSAVDLDRQTAQALVARRVAAVVNAAPSISGRFPNLGPEILVAAGIPLVDGVGADVLQLVRDGSRVRLHQGVLYAGERELTRGVAQTPESVADQMIGARSGMAAQLEAFSANTIEFLRSERTMILDGVGVPAVLVPMAGRHVLVVAGGPDHADDLVRLRPYLREQRPVLVGVGEGGRALLREGRQPDLIVADPGTLDDATLRCGAQLVVPADPDGHAPGADRVRDMGVSAVAFPTAASPQDMALLLAHEHGARLVVTAGVRAGLAEFLDRGRCGTNPSAMLTRLKLGGALVDARAVAALYRGRVSAWVVALLLVAALLAMFAALLVTGATGDYLQAGAGQAGQLWRWLREWWP
jgi:uncharacterized membrane-anchored protein